MSSAEETIVATIHVELDEFELGDETLQYSLPPFQIRPERATVTWIWDARQLQWEVKQITVRGPRVRKNGTVSETSFHENEYRVLSYSPHDRPELRHIELAEKHRPSLTA